MEIDPSVAVVSSGPLSGQRLVAATNTGGPTVDVWQPDTNLPSANTTWSHTSAADTNGPVPATHPALAWDGGSDADLVTAPPQTCATATGDVKLQTWKYHVGNPPGTPPSMTQGPDIPTLAAGHVESLPRAVIGTPTSVSGVAGKAITVYDEEDCATGDHQIMLALEGAVGLPLLIANGRMPAVSVLGTVQHNNQSTTALQIAYLSEPTNGQQDVLSLTCWLGANFGVPLLDCQSMPTKIDNNIVEPAPVTSGGTTVDPTAAPAIACDNGGCHAVWTEGAGGGRTRVYISHASPNPTTGAATWSARQQVASAAGNSASQFMPSVTAHGTRADVVYLDTRGNPSFDAYQTSLDGSLRGLDTSLTNGAGYSPGAGSLLGDRTDAVSFGANGTVYGYFPGQVTAEPPAVIESQVDHGTVAPKLMLHAQTRTIGKNTSTNVAGWLSYSDTDGDPVTFTVADPAHGSVMGSTYAADLTYAGGDAIVVKAFEGATPNCPTQSAVSTSTCDSTTHSITVTNQAPVFDAPEPAIVDEGGEVIVPLHATDADVGDVVNFSVMTPAPAPFNVPGRATTDANGNLHLKIPVGVRAMAPVTLMLRATDTTTGETPLMAQESIDITVRPNLKTPVISMVDGNVSTTGRRATILAPVTWSDIAASCLATGTCNTRRVWSFGDGSPPVTTMNADSVDHVFPGPGAYRGQVSAVILWGTSGQVAAAPKAFNVQVTDDGRLVYKLQPTVTKLTRVLRKVVVKVTARTAGTVTVRLIVKGVPIKAQAVPLAAGQTKSVTFRFSIKGAKTRRGTIRLDPPRSGLAGGVPTVTGVTRTFRF